MHVVESIFCVSTMCCYEVWHLSGLLLVRPCVATQTEHLLGLLQVIRLQLTGGFQCYLLTVFLENNINFSKIGWYSVSRPNSPPVNLTNVHWVRDLVTFLAREVSMFCCLRRLLASHLKFPDVHHLLQVNFCFIHWQSALIFIFEKLYSGIFSQNSAPPLPPQLKFLDCTYHCISCRYHCTVTVVTCGL